MMRTGYGSFGVTMPNGIRDQATHRVSWIFANGDIQKGMHVLHCCDKHYPPGDITNRRCVNPEHLRLGTNTDNMRDKVINKRSASGARHASRMHPERVARGDANGSRLHPESRPRGVEFWSAKLNDGIVREIRASTEMSGVVATRLGVHVSTVRRIRHGKTWRHVV
jgi:hypothetical protein